MPLSWVLKPIAVASAIAFSTLGVLSTRYQKARYYFHSTIFLTTLGAASLWGLLISLVAAAAGEVRIASRLADFERFNINYYVARSFYRVCHPLVGVDFDVEGQEHIDNLLVAEEGAPQSAVIIGNHQRYVRHCGLVLTSSMVDILYLGRIFPKRTSIMAKQELKWTPLLGQFSRTQNTICAHDSDSLRRRLYQSRKPQGRCPNRYSGW